MADGSKAAGRVYKMHAMRRRTGFRHVGFRLATAGTAPMPLGGPGADDVSAGRAPPVHLLRPRHVRPGAPTYHFQEKV